MDGLHIKDYVKEANGFESLDCEFKVKFNKDNPLGWIKAIAAFANIGGGVMYIGVADNGMVIGISPDEVDKEQRYFVDLVKTGF